MTDTAAATRAARLAKFTARQRAEFPYSLDYNRQGGPNTGVGLQIGSRVARSREHAEAIQRDMELQDAAYGHVTTYSIVKRAGGRGGGLGRAHRLGLAPTTACSSESASATDAYHQGNT